MCIRDSFYEFDDPYIGKSKVDRKYSRNATVPGLVMRPVEHVFGVRGRIVDFEKFRYTMWKNQHP